MDNNTNAINWFEIPAADIDRAQKFYETIFAFQMYRMDEMMGIKMVSFPGMQGNGKVSGAIVQHEMCIPSSEGCVLYLNANPDLQPILDRVVAAGGTIIMPRTEISPEIGYMAFFIDSEGNRIGLHSQA